MHVEEDERWAVPLRLLLDLARLGRDRLADHSSTRLGGSVRDRAIAVSRAKSSSLIDNSKTTSFKESNV
jgi:hypothetical protein